MHQQARQLGPGEGEAVGRRKTSVARVYLRPGSGNVVVNKRELAEYLPTKIRQASATAPLDLTELRGQFDVLVNAKGGGLTGQAEAIRPRRFRIRPRVMA